MWKGGACIMCVCQSVTGVRRHNSLLYSYPNHCLKGLVSNLKVSGVWADPLTFVEGPCIYLVCPWEGQIDYA